MRRTLHISVRTAVVLVLLAAVWPAWAINPYSTPAPNEVFLKGSADIGKSQAAIVTAQASVIANAAATNAAVAKAVDDIERIRTLALDNDLKAVKAFYDRRKMYADYRAQHAAQRSDKDDLARRAKPSIDRASAYQVDPLRGRIFWPSVLKREEFANARTQIDDLFAQRRSRQAGLGSNFCRQTKSLSLAMRNQLREMMDEVPPTEYLAARKFLDTLALEAQMPPRIEGVAAK
jgi:hypothetical protein